jgi:hypothetical protein
LCSSFYFYCPVAQLDLLPGVAQRRQAALDLTALRGGLCAEAQAKFPHRKHLILPNHQVIDKFDVKPATGFAQLACQQDILNIYMENLCVLFGSF